MKKWKTRIYLFLTYFCLVRWRIGRINDRRWIAARLSVFLHVVQQPLQVLDVQLLLFQFLAQIGYLLFVSLQTGTNVQLPGVRQGALRKALYPHALEVTENAHLVGAS